VGRLIATLACAANRAAFQLDLVHAYSR
jgi:hypothetical protein